MVVKHAFRHALIPVVTISGLIAGYLLSGAVIVEYPFGLNGLGSLLVDSVQGKDLAVVQAIALILVFAFLVINLIVDLLYALIDPRVRLSTERRLSTGPPPASRSAPGCSARWAASARRSPRRWSSRCSCWPRSSRR